MNEQELYRRAEELRAELNLRLFCSMEAGSNTMLWVEQIALTDIVYPKKKLRIWKRIWNWIIRRRKKYGNSRTICRT